MAPSTAASTRHLAKQCTRDIVDLSNRLHSQLSEDLVPSIPASLLRVEPGLAAALAAGEPVVALESTIITHGMPFPENLATAETVERIVRANGAHPATIALLEGEIRVGLDAAALRALASSTDAAKASRRDLAALLVGKRTAGTTVAATMLIAAACGIAVFATGGIGGVHRGADETFDISADLPELGSTGVAVVCAGAKSILDIAKTLEYLETQGVPVLGYRTDAFPAFYTRESGHAVDYRCESAAEVAQIIAMQRALGLRGGIVIANPVPEEHAIPAPAIEAHIVRAVADAEAHGIARKALTPFLLERVAALTEGASLAANIALIENNAALGAAIAVELALAARRPA
jgi:pseudouridine-5'-phosphate glycosidase